jgi:hypothetical protein
MWYSHAEHVGVQYADAVPGYRVMVFAALLYIAGKLRFVHTHFFLCTSYNVPPRPSHTRVQPCVLLLLLLLLLLLRLLLQVPVGAVAAVDAAYHGLLSL